MFQTNVDYKIKKYLEFEDLDAYRIAFHLSNYVWNIVAGWKPFEKDTIGKQFVRAIDSISANIAEGFGRYMKKDKINFYRYSRGSVKESLDWNEKSRIRGLLTETEYSYIFKELHQLPRLINQLIQYTNQKLEQ
ncbi:MAG: four helix bundle protein [Patescibacteria group bacterium]